MATDIRRLEHCFGQQINIYGQWEVIHPAVKLEEFIHAYSLAYEKEIYV